MTLKIQPVPTSNFHQTWPLVEEFFTKATKFSEDYTVDQIKALLASGSWLLLVATDEENNIHGAGSVNFINMPNDRVAFVTAISGKGIVNPDVYTQLTSILRGFGATKIQCAARESAAKLYEGVGFTHKHIILEVKI